MYEFVRKLIKSQSCCRGFCILLVVAFSVTFGFLVIVVDQMVKMPLLRNGTQSSFRMNCDGDGVPKTDAPKRTKPKPKPTTPAKTEPVTDIITEMPPIPETPAPVCENKYSRCSGVWRRYCLSRKYEAFMRKNCHKTCCCDAVDRHPRCSVWAKARYCIYNRGFMNRFCKKSCGCHTS